jgi:hypothetical protein
MKRHKSKSERLENRSGWIIALKALLFFIIAGVVVWIIVVIGMVILFAVVIGNGDLMV